VVLTVNNANLKFISKEWRILKMKSEGQCCCQSGNNFSCELLPDSGVSPLPRPIHTSTPAHRIPRPFLLLQAPLLCIFVLHPVGGREFVSAMGVNTSKLLQEAQDRGTSTLSLANNRMTALSPEIELLRGSLLRYYWGDGGTTPSLTWGYLSFFPFSID